MDTIRSDAESCFSNRTTFLPERRLIMQAWADFLDKLKSGGALWAGVKKRLTDIRAIQVTAFV